MRLIFGEAKKFYAFRLFWILLVCLLAVSGYVQLSGENDRYYTASDYRAFFSDTAEMDLDETQEYVETLLSSASGGRSRLFAAKGMILLLVTAALAILFIGENLLIGACSYGLGDLSRPIQSVYGFYACNLPLSVGQYLALFVILKICAYSVFAAVFSLIAVSAKNNLLVYGISALFCAVFVVLYISVPDSSLFALLHYWNPAAFTQVSDIWDTYRNVNLFGYPVSKKISSCLVAGLLLFGATTVAVIVFSYTPRIAFRTISLPAKQSHRFRVYPRFCYTLYRTLILHRGIWILLLAAAAVGLISSSWVRSYSNDEICYENFTEEFAGPVTQDTLDFIAQKREHYVGVREELDALYSEENPSLYRITFLEGEFSDEAALERFAGRAETIANSGGEIFYDTGYERLFSLDGSRENLVLVLIVSPCPAADRRTRMTHILFASSAGRRGYFSGLFALGACLSLVLSLLTEPPYLFTILSKYGTQGLDAPIQSLTALAASSLPLRLDALIALLFVMRTLCAALVSILAVLIASRCKTMLSAYLINLAVWVMPCAAVLIIG